MWKRILWVLFFPALLPAQTQEEFRRTPPGTERWILENARQIVQAGKDTTKSVFVAGVDQWAWYVNYTSRNDSINVRIYLDVSADGSNWKAWSAGAVDSSIISGTGNRDTLFQFSNPPNYAMFARARVIGAQAAADTVDVTLKWVLTWLPMVLNP